MQFGEILKIRWCFGRSLIFRNPYMRFDGIRKNQSTANRGTHGLSTARLKVPNFFGAKYPFLKSNMRISDILKNQSAVALGTRKLPTDRL